MDKRVKIVIMALLAFLVLGSYLVLTLKEVTIKSKTSQSNDEYDRQVQEQMQKIEEAYMLEMKNIFSKYSVLTASPEKSPEEINSGLLKIRDELKVMTVPVQFKELHMNLFLAFSEAEGTSAEEVNTVVSKITSLMTEARIAHDWLSL
ncbi:MAG: hypothetical protein Q7T50_06430 [Candidatus Magasanikbacteria bacterium]|nr:hypothetical protein [Candidatus Magasanikbacteria bacterium]